MDPELCRPIHDYQAHVTWAVQQIEQTFGVTRPASAVEWVSCQIPHGVAPDGNRYRKHGYGIMVQYEGGAVDFDFGEHGEIGGFCASRLFDFLEHASQTTYAFASEKDVDAAIREAEELGDVRHPGYGLYYLA